MYLYAIGCKDAVKFGIAKDVNARRKLFETGNPYPLILLASIQTENPVPLEHKIHSIFSKSKIRGEWFEHNKQIQSLINVIKENAIEEFEHLIMCAYNAHNESKDNPKYEGIYFDVETVIYGDGGFHLNCWQEGGIYGR